MSTNNPMTQEQLDAIRERVGMMNGNPPVDIWAELIGARKAPAYHAAPQDLMDLLAEVERLRTRAALADAMIERVAMRSAAKESFISRRQWEDLSHDERDYRRAQAHRILAADLDIKENA